jgi:hypothetical protein
MLPVAKKRRVETKVPYTGTRSAFRRRIQYARKSAGRSRIRSRVDRNCHSFRRMAQSFTEDVTGTGLSGAMTFSLGDTLGASEFDVLYDRFMITAVVVKIRIVNNPDNTMALNNSGVNPLTGTRWVSTNWYPRLFYCKDYDDNSAETLAQLRERAKTKMVVLKPNMYHKIVIRPAALVQTYYTALGSGYAPKWKQWIDMAQKDLPHYGLKYNIDCSGQNPDDNQPFKVEFEKQYFFKCKDVR